jgi:ribonuclease R
MTTRHDDWMRLVLDELGRDGYEPRRTKELARDLGIPKDDYRDFRDYLKEMQDRRLVEMGRGRRWVLPGARREEKKRGSGPARITGVLQMIRSGNGFVLPDDSSLDDLYVPEENLGAALDGDRVVAEREKARGRGLRRSGRIVEILERGAPRIVATVVADGLARPEDPRNPYDFSIEEDGPDAQVDDKILLEITRWPGEGEEPAGRILEVLGPAGEPDTETAAILARYDAPGPFPEEVKAAVRSLRRELTEAERAERWDLRELVCVTIDPPDARDFDDALTLEVEEDGTLRVGVHIADVARFVTPGSVIDKEARERSTSIYLPGRVLPMLPEELSNDLCSLRPREDRPARSVILRFSPEGERLGYTIGRSVIHSRRRFAYEEVRRLVDGDDALRQSEDGAVVDRVLRLHGLAQTLRARRTANEAIELNLPEFKVLMDEGGFAEDIIKVEHDQSHQLVEEYMLQANVAVADWCVENAMPVLHRQHESPGEEDAEELATFLNACGYPFAPPYSRSRLNEILRAVRGRPEEHAINLAVLRSFRQAVYGPDGTIGHFALNFPRYLHFTSPIRRYPDLHLHQALEGAFPEGEPALPKKRRAMGAPGGKALESLGEHCSRRERRAMKIEEAVKDFRRLELLSRSDEREFDAVVTGIRRFGIFVEIEDFFVEGMLPKWMLEKKGFAAREEAPGETAPKTKPRGGRVENRGFHLGEEVRVRITDIDLPARLCQMEFLGLAGR